MNKYTFFKSGNNPEDFRNWLNKLGYTTDILTNEALNNDAIIKLLDNGMAIPCSIIEINSLIENGEYRPYGNFSVNEIKGLMLNESSFVNKLHNPKEFIEIAETSKQYDPTSIYANGWAMERAKDEDYEDLEYIEDSFKDIKTLLNDKLKTFTNAKDKLDYVYNYIKQIHLQRDYLFVGIVGVNVIDNRVVASREYKHLKLTPFTFPSYDSAWAFIECCENDILAYFKELEEEKQEN